MGKMTITFLGTGTSLGVPIPGCDCNVCLSSDKRDIRLRTSCLVTFDDEINPKTGEAWQICIDAGPDFRYQMLRENVQYLDAILLTHEHRDHIAGLDDVRSYNYLQQCPMPVFGNKEALIGVKKMMYYAFENAVYPGVPEFELHEVSVHKEDCNKQSAVTDSDILNEIHFGNIKIMPIEVMHAQLPTLAYRIGDFAYITDAKTISNEEKQKLSGVKTLVVNALRREEHFSHFTLDEALSLIDFVQPDVAYLTHLSHLMGPYKDFGQFLPDNVHLAYDGLKITCGI